MTSHKKGPPVDRHPVSRLAKQVLAEWAEELSHHLSRPADQIRSQGLGAGDFPATGCLHIRLVDGSQVQFECAFHLVSPERHAIAVFTEHCGHHVFPLHDAIVQRLTHPQAVP